MEERDKVGYLYSRNFFNPDFVSGEAFLGSRFVIFGTFSYDIDSGRSAQYRRHNRSYSRPSLRSIKISDSRKRILLSTPRDIQGKTSWKDPECKNTFCLFQAAWEMKQIRGHAPERQNRHQRVKQSSSFDAKSNLSAPPVRWYTRERHNCSGRQVRFVQLIARGGVKCTCARIKEY